MSLLRVSVVLAIFATVTGCGTDVSDAPAIQARANNVFVAALNGDTDAVKNFLQQKPWLLKKTDANGGTPYTYAVESGNVDLVKYLAGLGADVNQMDARLTTPLRIAEKAGDTKMVEALKQLGATRR